MKKGVILVVDDNRNVLTALRIFLAGHFESVLTISTPNSILSTMRECEPDVVLLDMNFSAGINTGNEGLYWLSRIKEQDPALPVVLFTAYADVELAVKALKEGATDFVVKPWDNAKLLATLQSAYQLRQSRKEVRKLKDRQSVINQAGADPDSVLWGSSESMSRLSELVRKVAATDANVLITGENGTGKSLIARAIHRMSPRSGEVMVTVDMGAVTETLFESELFGHVKGAFTDARADRAGKFEAADKGTLFLDEIANLGLPLQAKLLNAIQTRQVVRVGSNRPVDVDVRLITATNRDLNRAVAEAAFREDLLYRINTIHVEVPPLRERKEDIAALAQHFLEIFSRKYGRRGLEISQESVSRLEAYPWPGNIRELEHAVEKAVILADGSLLKPSDFYLSPRTDRAELINSLSIEDMERVLIERSLKANGNNISAAAQSLGITRPTLYSKIKKHGIS